MSSTARSGPVALDDPECPRPRPPEFLMRPERLGALQPSRLSLSRAFALKILREGWRFHIRRFDIDAEARGTAVYEIVAPTRSFTFCAFSVTPQRGGRTGRIIGRAWDMQGALIEGPPDDAAIEATRRELPKLYQGRATPGTLVWCRSNRSMRAFDSTVEALAAGRQPDMPTLAASCYVMRNTGLDGNGTFGTRSFLAYEDDHPLRGALEAQMLTAVLMREFAADLVECLARHRGGAAAVRLRPDIRRFIGVGNGSALGLMLFVNNHPRLIHAWINAREEAIALAKALPVGAGDPRILALRNAVRRAARFRREDRMMYEGFAASAQVAAELETVAAALEALHATGQVDGKAARYPLAALADGLEGKLHPESVETLLSLMIELVAEQADRLMGDLVVSEELSVEAAMTCGALRDLLQAEHGWALAMDMAAADARRFAWYKSVTAEEPRRGPVDELPPGTYNLGLDIPTLCQALDAELASRPAAQRVSRLLLERPDLRVMVARIQCLHGLPYHAPHANIMGADFTPAQVVRLLNAAFHGIDKTRDFLGRNLRGVLLHGAPTAADIAAGATGPWFYPAEPVA
jgi:hypothetical protein